MIRPLRRYAPFSAIGLAVFFICLLTGRPSFAGQPNSTASQASNRVSVSYGKLPLSFEPNLGQTAKEVQWLARGPQYTLFLAGADAVLELNVITPPTAWNPAAYQRIGCAHEPARRKGR